MVWFYCDDCGDSIKKPKLANHYRTCRGQTFTCVDCSRNFDRSSAGSHNTCVSEHEKYALGATKPGGYAAQGFFKDGQQQQQPQQTGDSGAEEVIGAQFLSERPPWKCSCCNVSCTSRDTLLGHAAGVKHKRRARAALGLTGQQQPQQQQNGTTVPAEEAAQQPSKNAAAVEDAASVSEVAEEAAAGSQWEASEPDAAANIATEQHVSKKHKRDKNKCDSNKKQKKRKSSKDDEGVAVAAGGSEPQAAAPAEDQEEPAASKGSKKEKKRKQQAAESPAAVAPLRIADDEAAGSKKQKKQKKDNQKDKVKGKEQQQQLDIAPLLAVAQKRLKKKGKLGLKKLEALLKENTKGGFREGVVKSVQKQLLATSGVHLKGGDTLVWVVSNPGL